MGKKKDESDDEKIAPAVAESPRRVERVGSGSEGAREGLSGLARKTGREMHKAVMLRFEKGRVS